MIPFTQCENKASIRFIDCITDHKVFYAPRFSKWSFEKRLIIWFWRFLLWKSIRNCFVNSHVQQHKAVLIWSYAVVLHTPQIQCDVISVFCVSCCLPDWFHIVAWLKPPRDIWIKMEISEFGYETADSLRLYRCRMASHPRCIRYANVCKWQNNNKICKKYIFKKCKKVYF